MSKKASATLVRREPIEFEPGREAAAIFAQPPQHLLRGGRAADLKSPPARDLDLDRIAFLQVKPDRIGRRACPSCRRARPGLR